MSAAQFVWPAERAGEALEALARHVGYRAAPALPGGVRPGAWRSGGDPELTAQELGLELEAVGCPLDGIGRTLASAGPALWDVPGDEAPGVLALLPGGRRRVRVLTPDLRVARVSPGDVTDLAFGATRARHADEIERVLAGAGIAPRHRAAAERALLSEQSDAQWVGGLRLLRLSPAAPFLAQCRATGLVGSALGLVALHALQQALFIVAWGVIGAGIIGGRLDAALLATWALLLLSTAFVRLLASWTQGRLLLRGGALFKQRLMHGALRLEDESIRREGSGRTLARVLESEAVQSALAGGGIASLLALVEVVAAAVVLWVGAAGPVLAAMLALWVLACAVGGWRYVRLREHWTRARLNMTHDVVENIVGHRTRVAQQAPQRWHEGEDEALAAYVAASQQVDHTSALRLGPLARMWLIAGLAVLAWPVVTATASAGAVAVSLGGILLGARAIARVNAGVGILATAAIAWRAVAPIFHAGARSERPATGGALRQSRVAMSVPARGDADRAPALLQARELRYAYPGRPRAVLAGCDLDIRRGERVMLEGGSGAGKSTLCKLLAGLYAPRSGLLLLDGLDRATWGEAGWRRGVASVPQFHENHILTGPLALNLLMGRGWPAADADLAEAAEVCDELGLGPLLARMPGGLMQTVGETGWQLSHGERSRVYVARALLQPGELVIFDESFAALDPQTLTTCLEAVLKRRRTVLVIAHP